MSTGAETWGLPEMQGAGASWGDPPPRDPTAARGCQGGTGPSAGASRGMLERRVGPGVPAVAAAPAPRFPCC